MSYAYIYLLVKVRENIFCHTRRFFCFRLSKWKNHLQTIKIKPMKRLSEIILTVAFATFMIGQVSGQDNTTPAAGNDAAKQTTVVKQECGKFVDANKDGICDNAGTQCKNAKGANFVDANGDGKCDNYASGSGGQGKGNCGSGNCQKGQQNCPGHSKESCGQQKQGCQGQCPSHSPDKK
jgi:hypothetical protein